MHLSDLAPYERVVVTCHCGWIVVLLRPTVAALPQDMPIADLSPRLRCEHCQAKGGMGIRIMDERYRHLPQDCQPPDRVIVPRRRS